METISKEFNKKDLEHEVQKTNVFLGMWSTHIILKNLAALACDIEQYFHVVLFIMLYEIKSYWTRLSHGIDYIAQSAE